MVSPRDSDLKLLSYSLSQVMMVDCSTRPGTEADMGLNQWYSSGWERGVITH